MSLQTDAHDLLKEVWLNKFSINTPIPKENANFKIFVKDDLYEVGSEGSIGVYTGRQKSRKTFALCCDVASAIKAGPVGPFQRKTRGGIILWFDTEQPKNRFLLTQRRLYKLAGLEADPSHFHAFMLRRYKVEDRVFIIGGVIKDLLAQGHTIDLIVIDGIVDICPSMMESAPSAETVQHVMTWSDTTGADMICVLHMNKGNTGEMRGHLGTELGNKADYVIAVEKKKDDDVFSVIRCKDSRFAPFHSFELWQDKSGLLDEERGTWQDPNNTGITLSHSGSVAPLDNIDTNLPF